MLLEQLHVDARLVVVALEKAFGDQRDEVAVAFDVGREQRDVRLVAHGAVEAAARRDVGFAADDRHEPVLARGVVELHRAEHDAVVGQRDAGRAFLRGAAAQRIDATRAVEKRVLAMDVQMDERTQVGRVWGFGPGSSVRRPARDGPAATRGVGHICTPARLCSASKLGFAGGVAEVWGR